MSDYPYTVEMWCDGKLAETWACTSVASPALQIQGSPSLDDSMSQYGCTLNPADIPQAVELMHQWKLTIESPEPGIYRPKDGVLFLLALHATYRRGSRVWSTTSRSTGVPAEVRHAPDGSAPAPTWTIEDLVTDKPESVSTTKMVHSVASPGASR